MRILLAVDGSAPSQAAIHQVRDTPWPGASMIRVLSVAPEPTLVPEVAAVDYGRIIQGLLQEAESVARNAAAALAGSSATIEQIVRSGDPRSVILDEARKWGADLIVLGSHGRTGLKRLLMGSVAEYVMRHAHCSVEIAREPEQPVDAPYASGPP